MNDQPPPIPNDSRPVWELVIEDMHARDRLGRERYGVPLQAGNGRDALRDAYEESLDKTAYLKQAIIERDGLLAVVRLALDLFQFATFDNGVHSPSGQSEAEHWAAQCRERMEAILATTTEEN